MFRIGFDVGSNSVGSVWIDTQNGTIAAGTSIFPAGVDETDDKRGEPKNVKRRMTRRTRITLARRSTRKRELRLRLIAEGLLPQDEAAFRTLLEQTDPWELRAKGIDGVLEPFHFGRVLLHLSQRRGAIGLHIADPDEDDGDATTNEDGKVKKSIGEVRTKMLARGARTFGEFIAIVRQERVTTITTPDKRNLAQRRGVREFRQATRNKAASYEHCADRAMIRHEFETLWTRQKAGPLAGKLTDAFRKALDDESGDAIWRHKGFLFGQRRATWDVGTLGRCSLEPTERCVPHADMYASRFRVVETVNLLRIKEDGKEQRTLTFEERSKIKAYLSGPLVTVRPRGSQGSDETKPKTTVSVTDLRILMGWGRATRTTKFHFNIEADAERLINTDWFSREIICGAITHEKWAAMNDHVRTGLNQAILKFDPDNDTHAVRLKSGVMKWGSLTEPQADALVAAWKRRPQLDAKRLNISRKAVRNLLTLMDSEEKTCLSITEIEARKAIAADDNFLDATTGLPLDEATRRRYATGAKGASARDRYYMLKHVLTKNGKPIFGPDGKPLAEPPPAPMISNPVVRKAIHEVRRHLVAYMKAFSRKPDEVYVELSRESRMGKKAADSILENSRLRGRIRSEIADKFGLDTLTKTQRGSAVTRVILAVQQRGVCPLCGNTNAKPIITPRMAANGEDCEVAHIIPRASGGHNGLGNVVLSHASCNRDMGRRTPREFWNTTAVGGYDACIARVETIFGHVARPTGSERRSASGDSLWLCFFNERDDNLKIEQFKKDVSDVQGMTNRQDAATKYAAKQVMAYIADALYAGEGLPERGGTRRVFATNGMWTSRLRREWGLFFDRHGKRAKGVGEGELQIRREKDRGDHRHHAIDAIVIGYCTSMVEQAWEARERQAGVDLQNSADETQMENYRRDHPIPPPQPFRTLLAFREAVCRAVFGSDALERAICHRPVRRKLVGAFHEETLFGPVVGSNGELTEFYTSKKAVVALKPAQLLLPSDEKKEDAIKRLAERRQREKQVSTAEARKWAKSVVASNGYKPLKVEPPTGKGGIVRDLGLRKQIRRCLEASGLNPNEFLESEMKKLVNAGGVHHESGVPIRSAVLLRTMSDAVVVGRQRQNYATGEFHTDADPASQRAYLGGNNHHIEIRQDSTGRFSGHIVTAFEASQRKLAKLKAFRAAGIPKPDEFKKLSKSQRNQLRPIVQQIELTHPIVDRRNDERGMFIMSLCEGETLLIRQKMADGEIVEQPSYFIVAKLEKPQRVVLVPHWDARAATERKDNEGNKIPNSSRDSFSIVPSDLENLTPREGELATKVLVSPLGDVMPLLRD